MRSTLSALFLAVALGASAQVPIIDYGFLADDPAVVVNSVLVQPDGKILVGGFFADYAGTIHDHLVRLMPDGTVDPSFNPNGSGPGNAVEDMILMPDGRILIAGNFLTYNGSSAYFIARLLPDGTRDASFNVPPNSINGAVWAIELHDAHRVIAGGEFFTCSGHSYPHIARFNDDGSVDTSFDVGTGFSHNVHEILVLPDMRILVGGQFAMYNGTPTGHIALLSPGGPLDTSMDNDPGLSSGGGTVRALARQPDGKLLVGGYFQYHNGQPRSAIVRMNTDGSNDPTFTSPLYAYALVRTIAIQSDGKLVVGGEFTASEYANAVPGPARLVRLNADGSRDNSFTIGSGIGQGTDITAYVHDLAIQADGKIIVGGHFQTVDTESAYHQLVRLLPDALTGIDEATGNDMLEARYDATSGLLWLSADVATKGAFQLVLHTSNGQLIRTGNVLMNGTTPISIPLLVPPGMYLLGVNNNEQFVRTKVVVH
jgi:uncharacterized delta-60 repeat protein